MGDEGCAPDRGRGGGGRGVGGGREGGGCVWGKGCGGGVGKRFEEGERQRYGGDGRKFAPLLALENQDTEIDALINSFNTAVTDTANNIVRKHRPAKKPWVMDNILNLCDKGRELKQKKNTNEGAKRYREVNQQVKKKAKKGKGDMD